MIGVRELGAFEQFSVGDAKGVDQIVRELIPRVKVYPANWYPNGSDQPYDPSAGIRRNEEMIEGASALIAIWDGESPGTRHAIDYAARRVRIPTVIGFTPTRTLWGLTLWTLAPFDLDTTYKLPL